MLDLTAAGDGHTCATRAHDCTHRPRAGSLWGQANDKAKRVGGATCRQVPMEWSAAPWCRPCLTQHSKRSVLPKKGQEPPAKPSCSGLTWVGRAAAPIGGLNESIEHFAWKEQGSTGLLPPKRQACSRDSCASRANGPASRVAERQRAIFLSKWTVSSPHNCSCVIRCGFTARRCDDQYEGDKVMRLDSDDPERKLIGGVKLNKNLKEKQDTDFPLFEL